MEQPEYKFIVDQWDLMSSMFPYLVHFLVAVFQGIIALNILLLSRKILTHFQHKNKDVPWVTFMKFKLSYSKPLGNLMLVVSILLLTPLFFDLHFVVSGIAIVLCIIWYLFSKWAVAIRKRISRFVLLIISVFVFLFMLWENADPAKYSFDLCMKALKWRMYESSWQEIHDKTAPKLGEIAPNFELLSTDSQDTLRLSDYRNKKAVALIFGSHSCPPHSDGTAIINTLYQKYGNEVAFITIYLKEAHPVDKWWLGESNTQKVIFDWTKTLARRNSEEPQNITERREMAQKYREKLYQNKLPIYVDTMDDKVGEMYAAKPTRIYLLNKEGQVIYNPGFGPMAFNPKHLEREIERYLTQ